MQLPKVIAKRRYAIVTAVAFGAALIYVVVHVRRKLYVAATMSTLSSLLAAIPETPLQWEEGAEWRILTAPEVDLLVDQIPASPPREWWPGEPVVDSWGKRIRVALRSRNSETEYAVWSFGPDGVSSTTDDVFICSTRRIPVQGIPNW